MLINIVLHEMKTYDFNFNDIIHFANPFGTDIDHFVLYFYQTRFKS
jgi:hypothetical protein